MFVKQNRAFQTNKGISEFVLPVTRQLVSASVGRNNVKIYIYIIATWLDLPEGGGRNGRRKGLRREISRKTLGRQLIIQED
jgi:hypothetical protein